MDDHVELITVLQELHNISGLRLSVHDTDFHEIEAYPKGQCALCAMVQKNEQALQVCHQTDYAAFERAKKTQQFSIYQCRFGLYEAVAPIFSFGTLIGYLMMGQTLCSPESNRLAVYEAALPYVDDPARLRRIVDGLPLRDRDKIVSCLHIMDICAKYISLSNRFNPEKADLAPAIKKYINENYRSELSLEVLRSHFFCSRATVINAFQKRYGIGISRYVTTVRIGHARELLMYSRRSIKEIALDCGFSDQNYFSKVFLKETGKTPTQFRREEGRMLDNLAEEEYD